MHRHLLSIIFLFTSSVTYSQIFVDSSATTGGNDGTSWINAYVSLQDALSVATAGDSIFVSKGTYYPDVLGGVDSDDRGASFVIPDNLVVLGGFNTASGDTTLVSRDWRTNLTILSGDIDQTGTKTGNSRHVITASNTNNNTLIDGVVIEWGYASGSADPAQRGGGLYGNNCDARIWNTTFRYNEATGFDSSGGAVFVNNDSKPVFENCLFYSNQSQLGGGAIGLGENCSLRTKNTVFRGNRCIQEEGGSVIYGKNSSTAGSVVKIVNTTISGNRGVGTGSAIHLESGSALTIENSIIWKNNNPPSIIVYSPVIYVVRNSIIEGSGGSTDWMISNATDGGANKDIDPQFVQEAIPSTAPNAEGNLRLKAKSPAINMGDNSLYTAAGGPPTDLDNIERIQIGQIDLGAYEFNCPPPVTLLYVDSSATGANTGLCWKDAFTSLQDALINPCDYYDSIFVSKGTYYPDESEDGASNTNERAASFVIPAGVFVYGGFNTSTGDTTLRDRDWKNNPTILSGDIDQDGNFSGNSFNVVTASTGQKVLDGFTITWGNATGGTVPRQRGAGVFCNNGTPILQNLVVIHNQCQLNGAGMFFSNGAAPRIYNAIIADNEAEGGGGVAGQNADMLFVNTEFRGNFTTAEGGALLVSVNSDADLINCTFSGNRSGVDGGAIYQNGGTVTVQNSIIRNNSVNGSTMGSTASIYVNSGTASVISSIIDNSGGSDSWVGGSTFPADGGNNKDEDPLFVTNVDPNTAPTGEGNLDIQLASPARNMGNNTLYPMDAPNIDLDCNKRIRGNIIDMGGYEAFSCNGITTLYVDSAATPGGDGLSWPEAFTDLQDALQFPCTVDSILVSKGTYYPDRGTEDIDSSFVIPSGIVLLGGFDAQNGQTSLATRDWKNNLAVLSGDLNQDGNPGGNSLHVLRTINAGSNTILDGFIVERGSAINGSGPNSNRRGGGLLAVNSDLQIRNTVFRFNQSNSSNSSGGAVFVNNNSDPVFENCIFYANQSSLGGGAIGLGNNCTLQTINTMFRGNRCSQSPGGSVIYGVTGSAVQLINTTVSGNRGPGMGSAIDLETGSSMTIENSIVWNNNNSPSVLVDDPVTYVVRNSIIEGSGGSSNWMLTGATDGGGNKDTDPVFVTAADTATAPNNTGDLRLQVTSPAINTGDSSLYPNTAPEIDLAGADRIQFSEIDMGAYEAGEYCPPSVQLYVDSTATGANTGLTWKDAFTSLQDALSYECDYDSIYVSKGTYYPDEGIGYTDNARDSSFVIPDNVVVWGGFNTASGDTTIASRDWKTNLTILSGDIDQDGGLAGNCYHVVVSSGVSYASVLDGFVIEGGNANGNSNATRRGGGILNGHGDVQLRNLIVRNNFAQDRAGGVYLINNSDVYIENSSFYNNIANQRGGAFYVGNSDLSMVNVAIFGNRAALDGAAIYSPDGEINLTNVTISGNSATAEGSTLDLGGACNLVNSIIWNNFYMGTDTNAMVYQFTSATTITNSIVQNSGGSGNWMLPNANDEGGNKDVDPQFVLMADPATAPNDIGDLRLVLTSPAIDMGDSTLYPVTAPDIDLACDDRIQGMEINMGAYESVDICPVSLTLYVDSAATGQGNGFTWSDAFTSLQDALNFRCPVDSIFVSKGTYYPDEFEGGMVNTNDRDTSFVIPDSLVILGGFDVAAGAITLETRDWKVNETVLSGDIDQNGNFNENSARIIEIPGSTTYSVINGVTIIGGFAARVGRTMGGAIHILGGVLTLENSIVQGNRSSGRGGAVFLSTGSTFAALNTSFAGNYSLSGTGGAMDFINAGVTLVNTVFKGNRAVGGGGAISARGSSMSTIINSTFSGNRGTGGTSPGGTILSGNMSEMYIANSIIWNNRHQSDPDAIEASITASAISTTTITNSIVDNSGGSSMWNVPNVTDGGNNKDLDPLFVIPAVSTGLTNDMGDLRLMISSPAINMGDNTLYADSFPAIDLACDDRIQQNQIDMGAYEFTCDSTGNVAVLYVDSAATGANTGLSWEDAFIHLQDALNYLCPVDSILVSEGTYYPDEGNAFQDNDRTSSFQIPDSLVILGGFSTASGDTTLASRDWKNNLAILDGDINQNSAFGGNAYQVVVLDSVSEATVLDGFTITGGNANGTTLVNDAGGGIYVLNNSSPKLYNLNVTGNRAILGGGIANDFRGSPTLFNVIIGGNTSTQNGGGLFNNNSSPLLVNVSISGNSASIGGGVFNFESSPLLVNTTIGGNNATNMGGGIANRESSSTSISNSIIWNNLSNNSTETIAASISNSSGSGTTISYSIVDNSGGSDNWMLPTSNIDNGGNKDIDPQFVIPLDPASAPNDTGNLRLQISSPAIDMGDSSLYADTFPAIDLGCEARIRFAEIDMGAYETQFCVKDTLVCRDITVVLDSAGQAVLSHVQVVEPGVDPDTTFTPIGSLQEWTVPAGVTSVYMEAVGGKGGNAIDGQGGSGALVGATFMVVAGEQYQIIVGQRGSRGGNGGGGGGASFIAAGSNGFVDFQPGNILLIAGGGGGARLYGNGGSSVVLQSSASGPGGSIPTNGGSGGGGSSIEDGEGLGNQGGKAAIHGAAGGTSGQGNGGFGGGGAGEATRSGGGGGGATGGNRNLAGTSYNGGQDLVFIPAYNKSGDGRVRIYYNYELSESYSINPDTLTCEGQGIAQAVQIIRTNCDGRTDTCTTMVTPIDLISPGIEAPVDVVVYCPESTDPQNTGRAMGIATDSCDIDTVLYIDNYIDNACTDTLLRAWYAVDARGNESIRDTQVIAIQDTVAPQIICLESDTISCGGNTAKTVILESTTTPKPLQESVLFDTLTVPAEINGPIQSVAVQLKLKIGDSDPNSVVAAIRKLPSSNYTFLFDNLNMSTPCDGDDMDVTFLDGAASTNQDFIDQCNPSSPVKIGQFQPDDPLSTYAGQQASGDWELAIAPSSIDATDSLMSWSLIITYQPFPEVMDCSETALTFRDDTTCTSGSCGALIERTWIATDGCGNADSCMQMITVVDTIPPMPIFCPSDTTLNCSDNLDTAVLGVPIYLAISECDSLTGLTFRDDIVGFDGTCLSDTIGSIYRTFFASFQLGNIDSTCVQMITVIDTISPLIICPPDIFQACTFPEVVPTLYDTLVTRNPDKRIGPDGGTITRDTITLTDVMGITVQNVYLSVDISHRFSDQVLATLTSPSGTTVEVFKDIFGPQCNERDIEAAFYDAALKTSVEYDDQCNVSGPARSGEYKPVDPFANFAGETIGGEWILTITDVADVGAGRLNSWTLGVGDGLIVHDDCSDAKMEFRDDTIRSPLCPTIGEIVRTWIATDECGHRDSCVQHIQIFTPLAEIICPSDTTVDCASDMGIESLGMARAEGVCAGVSTNISFSDTVFTGFLNAYGYAVGGRSGADTLVRFDLLTGDTVMVATVPTNGQVQSLTGGEFLNGQYYLSIKNKIVTINSMTGDTTQVMDLGDIERFYAMEKDPTTGLLYGIGRPEDAIILYEIDLNTKTITTVGEMKVITQPVWLAIDLVGNAYVLDALTDAIYRIDLSNGQIIASGIPVNDGSNTIDVQWSGDAEFVTTTEGTFIYGLFRTDILNTTEFGRINPQTGEFITRRNIGGFYGAFASPGLIAKDTCPVVQTIVRTFIAEDECGQKNLCTQTIEVVDTTAPVFVNLEDTLMVACMDDTIGLVSSLEINECHLDTLYYNEESATSGGCMDSILRIYTAIDQCGNSRSKIQIIIIRDTIPPQPVSCPPVTFINCEAEGPLPISMPNYTDNCSPSDSIVVTTEIDSVGFGTATTDDDTIFIHYIAEDLCGNVDSSCTQVVLCRFECPTINCHGIVNVGLGSGCSVEITPDMILNQPLIPAFEPYCEITLQDEFGHILPDNIISGSEALGHTFTVTIRCGIPGCGTQECQTTVIVDNSPAPLNFISAWQSTSGENKEVNSTPTRARLPQKAIIGPNISKGKINVYCGNIPAPSEHIPMVTDPCSGKTYIPEVQPDWVMPIPCDKESDTAEVIFRTWEAYDKEGNLSTLTDTIVVFRLPKLTPEAFVGTNEDSFYCELEAVPHDGDALKRYASWKQPVGLHDYELPYTKLRGVTYEIPATIILAGYLNAQAQGPDVLAEYLKCVILRKENDTEVTIGDIVSRKYMNELRANATQQQLGYGFLHLIYELNEKPLNVIIEAGLNFYPYLLLQPGDWILSEGGNFEQVEEDWFYHWSEGSLGDNGTGNAPYWFAGGWPSIYGSGDCVRYCDVGTGNEFGCIEIQVPLLDTLGFNAQMCDTICIPTGVHCGISIQQDELAAWDGSCPQTRGLDTWITQTCWAATPNSCAEDAVEFAENCEDLTADLNEEDAVMDYECSDKAIKIHLSQWQTLYDTIGPIFDFCYPTTGSIISCQDFQDGISWIWDETQIQEAIGDGRQYGGARAWESCNPTTYRVGTHDCEAEVYVPDVRVIDNCSGVHHVKAMVEVAGGTRAVALEWTGTETTILANGDTCYIYTYSHTSDPITIPFNGSEGEPIEVHYEAADNCWNQSELYKYIKITDDVSPTVVVDHEVTVPLQNKIAWVHAETFDEGSWDNCSIDLHLARRTGWFADTACVNLCDGSQTGKFGLHAPYDNWVDLLDDLGVDRNQAIAAVGGGIVGEDNFNSKYNVNDLSTVLNEGEVEEYYFDQIVWMWEDGELCGEKVVHGWLYSIAAYIAENCSVADEHGNVLQVRDLENIFDNLTGRPGYGKEIAYLGGGWSKSVPFKCQDVCEEVTVELAVFDNCCNWGKGWSTAHVEDKGNARLVKRLPDLDISCEAYNIYYKDMVESAAALGQADGQGLDSTGVLEALNGALGSYVKTWVDNQNRPTDIDGDLLPDSVLNFEYKNASCAEKSETEKVAVEGHDGQIEWVNRVTKTTYLDTTEETGMNGIIGINCAASCIQDVWVDLDECGQGTITRRFYITGGCGPNAPTWTVEQEIRVTSACGLRESMFDLPENIGTKDAPICLPEGLSETYFPDTLGGAALKPGLEESLCNSVAIGHEIKELDVLGAPGMKKYLITWSVIDWCADHTSSTRQFTYTQEVIATINPDCDVTQDTTGDVSITGHVMTELNSAVNGVEVKAVLGKGSPIAVETPESGEFSLTISNDSQVSVIPRKNTGFANGVSTADLIDIQRHVLQKKALDSKYQRIAADVNGNGRIDGLDVLELRQLVLNPSRSFANNTSWRFYEATMDREVYEIDPLTEDQTVDFTAVKIGDVNLSGDPARRSLSGAEVSRSTHGQLRLNIADQTLKGGSIYHIDVRSDNFEAIRGLQYTLSYASPYVSIESIEPGLLNITPDNYLKYSEGVVTSSWNESEGVNANADEVLFTIVLKAKNEAKLRDVLSLNDRVTQSEAYESTGELKDVSLYFDGNDDGFALYQNTPNPYKGETVIGFKLPQSTSATMTIYDITGRLIKRIEGNYEAGYNEVRVRSTDLGTTGVLYYQLDTDKYTATKKMIIVE